MDAVAVAGGADHGAGPAAQALVTPLLPDGRLELDVQQVGQVVHIEVALHEARDAVALREVEVGILVGDGLCLEAVDGREPLVRAHGREVAVADIRQKEVEAVGHRVRAERPAEGTLAGVVVDPHDEGVPPPGEVVGAGVPVLGEDLVQLEEPVDVAGVKADDGPRLNAVTDGLVPVPVLEAVGGELLAEGKEIGLGRILRGLVPKVHVIKALHGEELVDRLSPPVRAHAPGAHHLVAVEEGLHERFEGLLFNGLVEHAPSLLGLARLKAAGRNPWRKYIDLAGGRTKKKRRSPSVRVKTPIRLVGSEAGRPLSA